MLNHLYHHLTFLLILSLGLPSIAYSQFRLSGKVIDQDKEFVEFASISLFNSIDSSLLTGEITDIDGKFEFKNISEGAYYIIVSHILYSQQKVEVLLNENLSIEITLEKDVKDLSEIVVSAEELAIQNEIDKITINPEKIITGSGGSAIDLLRSVPIVNISPQGAITMRGNGDIQVLINGKPSGMVAIQGTQILSQLDANSIEKIELITSPSASSSPDGGAGIINIILKKDKTEGLKGSILASIGNGDRYNLSPSISYRKNDLNFFARYNFQRQTRRSESIADQLRNDTLSFDQMGGSRRVDLRHNLEFGMDLFLNERQYFTLSGLYRDRNKKHYQNQLSEVFTNDTPSEIRNTQNAEPELNEGWGLTLSYFSENEEEDNKTEIYLDIVHSVEDEIIERIDEVQSFEPSITTFDGGYSHYIDINDGIFFDASIEKPWKEGKIDMGSQYFYRNIDQTFDYRLVDPSVGEFESEFAQNDQFNYNDHVASVYTEIEYPLGKFKLGTGVRLEYSTNQYTSGSLGQDFSNEFFNVFPSAKIGFKATESFNVQINYNRRINRPAPSRLNPFPNIANPFQIELGNPDLKPEFVDAFNLGFSKTFQQSSLSVNFFWNKYNDLIQRISTIDENAVRIIAPINLDQRNHYGADLGYFLSLAKNWDVNVGFVFFKNDFNSDLEDIDNSGFTQEYKLNSTWKLASQLDWQISAYYNSAVASAQGEARPLYSVDTGIKYEFLPDKMELNLSVSDIFNTLREISLIDIESYFSRNETKIDTRRVRLTVRWKL